MPAGLKRNWSILEAMVNEEKLTCGQIAWIMRECSKLSSLDSGGLARRTMPDGERPLGARLVQLVSYFVCDRVPQLTPEEITTFVVALTSTALPMDEFWLFMMAKRVQDSPELFTIDQIVIIAKRYADKGLEDDEFFEALANRVTTVFHNATLEQVSGFLLACGKVRFVHEELCRLALSQLEDPEKAATLHSEALSATVTAVALLDQSQFKPAAVCNQLAGRPAELRRLVAKSDLAMGIALASVSLRDSSVVRLLLPMIIEKMHEVFLGGKMSRKKGKDAAMVLRRLTLLGLCTAFSVPSPSAWALPLVRQMSSTMQQLEGALQSRSDLWEPQPSSFHLEVVAVLQLLNVEHSVEVPQRPFCLDLTISPEQLRSAEMRWAAAERAKSAAEE